MCEERVPVRVRVARSLFPYLYLYLQYLSLLHFELATAWRWTEMLKLVFVTLYCLCCAYA